MSHFEVSPREKEDERERWEHEFGVRELQEDDQRDITRRSGTPGPQETGK
jgi:hypothetical protein